MQSYYFYMYTKFWDNWTEIMTSMKKGAKPFHPYEIYIVYPNTRFSNVHHALGRNFYLKFSTYVDLK